MNQFALLFRKDPKQISEADERQRGEEVEVWSARLVNDGRALEPRSLGDQRERIDPEGEAITATDWPLVFALLLQANTFSEAVSIAKTHPGLRYGLSVEVRPWQLPPQPIR